MHFGQKVASHRRWGRGRAGAGPGAQWYTRPCCHCSPSWSRRALAHPHACPRAPCHSGRKAKVTKCLSSQGRHRREKAHQAPSQGPLLLYLILPHRAVLRLSWRVEQESEAQSGSATCQVPTAPNKAQPTAKPAPGPRGPLLATAELCVI